MVIGSRTGGLFCCGMSHLAIVLSHFQASQVSEPSSLDTAVFGDDLLEDGRSHRRASSQVCVQPKVGTGTFLTPCADIGALLLPQEVSCLLLATPSHMDAQGFVQPCGELGQGHDLIKNCGE